MADRPPAIRARSADLATTLPMASTARQRADARARFALVLRTQGMAFREIARLLGLGGPEEARRLVARAARRQKEAMKPAAR
jgi:hypothetical protein